MKHIGLFEGIGGFSLAARWMGWETLAWCEWNEFGQKVLSHHFPKAEGFGDITKTDFTKEFMWSILPLINYGYKWHTIRQGKHFKEGDYFSPRVWTGTPYRSKQIIIAPDIKVEKTFDFRIEIDQDYLCVFIDDYPFYEENSRMVTQTEALETLAKNDGLSVEDFKKWFKWGKAPFDGQIKCWNKEIEY